VRVTSNPGGDTFNYEGVQASDNPAMTIWMFSVYGGLRLSGDPDAPHEEVSKVGAVTGSKRFMDIPEVGEKQLRLQPWRHPVGQLVPR
jgi:hypothetical protein